MRVASEQNPLTEAEKDKPIEKNDLVIPGNIFERLLLHLHLARTTNQAIVHSAGLFIVIAFIPLLLLSLVGGTELNGSVEIPLHKDFITLSRYLIAAPIFILSDIITRPWLIKAVARFAAIVDAADVECINETVKRVSALRNSLVVDLVMLVLAFVSTMFGTSVVLAVDATSWQITAHGINSALTPPGYWNAFVSQPLFRFVILSWFFDYALWTYFLWRVSRLRLEIIPTHPDGAGGLSFVTVAQSQFCVVAFALSCAICSVIARGVQRTHVELQSFTNLGLVFLAVILILFVGPLLVFSPRLLRTKCNGVFSYGALCHDMSHSFAKNWIRTDIDGRPSPIIESEQPSALADLNSSFQTVITMRPTVFDRQFIVSIVIVTCLPAVPLIASVIPLQDLIMQIFKALS